MLRASIRLGVLLFVSAVQIFGCSDVADDDHIIIGVIAPLARNLPVAEGATLAADEINAAGGIDVGGRRQRIRLLVGDTESRPETAVSKALELISRDRAVALVGLPRSHSAIPVARLAEQQRVPLISTMSTHPETTAGKRYVFRLAFLNALQGRVLADFAFHDLGARRAAILVDAAGAYSSDLAKVFERVFQEHGGQVVAHEVFTEDDLVVARQLRTIKDSDADILFMPQHAEIVTLHGREARRLGIAATLLGSDTWSGIDSRDHPAFNDSYFSDFWAPDSADEKARGFITAYRRAFDADPLASAALSYDAVSLIAEAIRVRGGADSESITAGIASLGSFHGVSGTIDFRGSGDPVRSVFIRKVGGDGQIRLFKEVSP